MNNVRQLVILVLVLPAFSGCSFLSLVADSINPERNRDSWKEYKRWEATTRGMLQSKYLSASKSDVEDDFGKPFRIIPDISVRITETKDGKNEPMSVISEMWVYQFKKGIPWLAGEQYSYVFYFADDHVIQTLP